MDPGGSRQHNRYLVDDCVVEVKSGGLTSLLSKGEFLPVVDLSEGGMQVIMFEQPKLGRKYHFTLTAGKKYDFVAGDSDIRWWLQIEDENAFRVGIQFTKLSDEDTANLGELLQDFAQRQPEILHSALARLKVPQSVQKKLVAAICEPRLNKTPMVAKPGEGPEDAWGGVEKELSRPKAHQPPQAQEPQVEAPETEAIPEPAPPKPAPGLAKPADDEDSDDIYVADMEDSDDELPAVAPDLAGAADAPAHAAEPEVGRDELSPETGEDAGALAESTIGDEGEPPADEPPPAPRQSMIPLYLLGRQHKVRVDDSGRPVGRAVGELSLPKFGSNHFACRLSDSGMLRDDGFGFRIGDVIVFSMEGEVEDGDFAFAATDEKSYFREVVVLGEDSIVLNPLNQTRKQRQVRPSELKAFWPAVAVVRLL